MLCGVHNGATTATAGEARKDRRSPTASSRARIAVDALDICAARVLVESASDRLGSSLASDRCGLGGVPIEDQGRDARDEPRSDDVLDARVRSPRPRRVRHARRAGVHAGDGAPETPRASRRPFARSRSPRADDDDDDDDDVRARRVAHPRARAEDRRGDHPGIRRVPRHPAPRRQGAQAQAGRATPATARRLGDGAGGELHVRHCFLCRHRRRGRTRAAGVHVGRSRRRRSRG